MSLPLGFLAHQIGSSTSKVNISQTRTTYVAYHISIERSCRGESIDMDLQVKLNVLALQNPRQGWGTSLVQGNPNPRTWVFNHPTLWLPT